MIELQDIISNALTDVDGVPSDEQDVIDAILDKFALVKPDADAWHDYISDMRARALLQSHSDEIYDVTLSKPHSIIQFSKAVLLTADFRPRVTLPGESEMTRAAQSAYERYVASLWDEDEDRQAWPLRDQFITNTLVDGSAWLQIYVDPRHAPPDALHTEWFDNPLTLELVDTLQIYPALSSNHQRLCDYVITYHKESLHDLRIQWPDKPWDRYGTRHDETGREIGDRQYMIDVYNYHGYDEQDQVVQTICTDKILLADEVLWPASYCQCLPWIISDCYSQPAPADGQPLSLIARFQSMLHPITDDVESAEHLLSADMRAVDLYGNMPPVLVTKAGRQVEIDEDWGNAVNLEQGEELGFPRWPGNPPDSSRLLAFMLGEMGEASFSAAAMGNAGSSASGYHVALTTEASRARLYIPARSIARCIAKTGRLAADMLRLYFPHTTFYVSGPPPAPTTGFHPAMTQGMNLKCSVTIHMPGDDVKKAAIATQHRALGLPLATILEDDLGYEQPDDIMRRIDEEKLRQHPIMLLARMMEALAQSNSPLTPLVLHSLQNQVAQLVAGANAPNSANTEPGFRPPNQGPLMGAMGQDVIPLAAQGYGELPGAVPQNQPMF